MAGKKNLKNLFCSILQVILSLFLFITMDNVIFLLVDSSAYGNSNQGKLEEWIVVSGGPALRFFEHGKADSHDKYWGNFIRASVARIEQLQLSQPQNVEISWLVFRPGYLRRSKEEKLDILAQIVNQANALGVQLFWFDTKEELINYLNFGKDRKYEPIGNFDYFGHSNKACFMFDYSSQFDNLSQEFLHEKELALIEKKIFTKKATIKSWGCHSGEFFSQKWKKRFGIPMTGAVGKTDYTSASLPYLSKNGKWTQ
ncbi:hypothetical protein [Methylacidiphilum caldifontis]|uniref:Uncharacterized protein n=1 Tax=Methylacidiphilum caldifontis TaxID=2795386 RepID=A0A4Y8PDH1_9BACT|nr:hypothetical protein [Methylacidiphilum caldifontis]QSR88004.1 hypothetical protein IT6_06265 [Methylacidiphilum caldifontis]TFE69542.1 hypothetical protein A7Q10_06720 [Methylacidiphilum caldifontis]